MRWRCGALRDPAVTMPSSSATMRSMRRASSRLWVAISAAEAGAAHELDQQREDAVGGVWIEIAGRLVGQQQRRAVGQRAGDGDALLLAAGEPRRAMLARAGEPDLRRAAPAARRRASPRGSAGDHLRQRRRSPAPRIPAADDETDRRSRCALRRSSVRSRIGQPPQARPADQDLAGGRPLQQARRSCSSVDLPAPDGPTSATISPGADRQRDAGAAPRAGAGPLRESCG